MIFGKPDRLTVWYKYQIQCYCDFNQYYISKKSVLHLFGYNSSAEWLSEYLQTFQKFTAIPEKLLLNLSNPDSLTINVGKQSISEEVYSLETFFSLCQFIVRAKEQGFIGLLDLKIANLVETIIEYNSIIPLSLAISETTGRNFFVSRLLEKTADLLEKTSADSSYKWINSLPPEFINTLFELRNLNWEMADSVIPELANLLQKIVFNRLPRPVHRNLCQTKPKRSYRRKNYVPQTIGIVDLEEILIVIKGLIITTNYNESLLHQLLDKIYPTRPDASEVQLSIPKIQFTEQESQIQKFLF